MMKRRDFITLLGGAVASWPLVARAQQAMPVIGYLSGATFETMREYVAAFRRGLADEGFFEGRNVAVEYRWAENYDDRLPALATDLVRRQPAVIAASTTPSALALKEATQTVPIVFVVGTDPVKIGLVARLARPGGNITGVTVLNVELIAKSLELMHDVMPSSTTIAVLLNPANIRQAATERTIIQDTARTLGARVMILEASTPSEIESAFATIVRERLGALVVSGENFFLSQRDRLVDLAAQHRVPTIYGYREFVTAGGLMSYRKRYGWCLSHSWRKSRLTCRLSKPRKIEMAVNLKIAKALGLTIPLPLLGRADEVIE